MNQSVASTGGRALGLNLSAGTGLLNLNIFYLTCLVSIMMAAFLPQSQAFLLAEYLKIPEANQGVVSGNLSFWGEIVIIATVGVFGAMSDRLGRRIVMAGGFAVMALAFYLYPRAVSINELLLYRLIYSVGIAAVSCMIVTVVADYVQDSSRGKATGYLGVMNGIGAMIAAFVLIKLPGYYVSQGMTPLAAGQLTFGIVAVVAVLMAIASWFGLRKMPVSHLESQPGLRKLVRDGLGAARDPGIALAYAASFVARGNLAIVGTFLALWFTTHGTSKLGLDAATALSKASMIIGFSYMASFVSAPVFGLLSDRINRVSALAITLFIAAVGYGGTLFVSDPYQPLMLVMALLIGVSEVGCIITSGVLIAQQAPAEIRGAVMGIFNLSGAVGILVATKVGGYLFDHLSPSGPFVLFGIVAAVVFLGSLVIRRRVIAPAANTADPLQAEQAPLLP